jgi:hypothetical protein
MAANSHFTSLTKYFNILSLYLPFIRSGQAGQYGFTLHQGLEYHRGLQVESAKREWKVKQGKPEH